jgi:hypothetical protein
MSDNQGGVIKWIGAISTAVISGVIVWHLTEGTKPLERTPQNAPPESSSSSSLPNSESRPPRQSLPSSRPETVTISAPDPPSSKTFQPLSPAQISIKLLDKRGLYLASTTLLYSDGDQLKADFRIYCPTSTIRPTNYVLVDKVGTVKKQEAWWEPAFTLKYDSEYQLIKEVCNSRAVSF